MATSSSDNSLASLETWAFRTPSTFDMPWLTSEAYARDTEALTRALQKSISSSSSDMILPTTYNTNTTSFQQQQQTPTTTQSFSNVSSGSSDPETAAPVSKRAAPKNGPKSMKRKSRASKRSPTTFITADPAYFRQMVQQVTGIRVGFGPGHGPVLKPEPQRPGLVNRLQTGCLLPTLDTSAFLLDHHYQQAVGPHGGSGSGAQSVGALGFGPSGEGSVSVGVGVGGGSDFDGFNCFPTLESWS